MAIKAPAGEPNPPSVTLVPVEPDSELARLLGQYGPEFARAPQLLIVALDDEHDESRVHAVAEALELVEHAQLDSVVSLLAPELAIPSAPVLEQSRRNLRLREEMLRTHGALTAREVADLAGSEALNRSQFAHSLTRSGRIFSVTHRRQQLFPGFQFDSEGPLPVVAQVLPFLRARFRKDWEVALWFDVENSWLDGVRPLELLISDPDRVVAAAQAGADRGGF